MIVNRKTWSKGVFYKKVWNVVIIVVTSCRCAEITGVIKKALSKKLPDKPCVLCKYVYSFDIIMGVLIKIASLFLYSAHGLLRGMKK